SAPRRRSRGSRPWVHGRRRRSSWSTSRTARRLNSRRCSRSSSPVNRPHTWPCARRQKRRALCRQVVRRSALPLRLFLHRRLWQTPPAAGDLEGGSGGDHVRQRRAEGKKGRVQKGHAENGRRQEGRTEEGHATREKGIQRREAGPGDLALEGRTPAADAGKAG